MARKRRRTPAGFVYHVCNRGSRKGLLFEGSKDYDLYLELMERARRKRPVRIIGYSLMKTHVHLVLWPTTDRAVPDFMKWLTENHARQFHRKRNSVGTGAVYQSRYVSVGVDDARHYFTMLKYVERNALKAGYVDSADEWPWCSLSAGDDMHPPFDLDEGPFPRPANWLEIVNDL